MARSLVWPAPPTTLQAIAAVKARLTTLVNRLDAPATPDEILATALAILHFNRKPRHTLR